MTSGPQNYTAFADAHMTVDAAGGARLVWPEGGGAVKDSARVARVAVWETLFHGREFVVSGPSTNSVGFPIDQGRFYGWGQLSLPPHRQFEPLHRYQFTADADARLDALNIVMVLEAVAPAFGLPGGGMQVRWFAEGGVPVSPAELVRDGVVVEVYERG